MIDNFKSILRPLISLLLALSCTALLAGCEKEKRWELGESAPEFSAIDLNDKMMRLSDFRGKVVVLKFWSRGCGICVAEMPAIDELSRKYEDRGLVILAINRRDSKESVEKLVRGLNISYPLLLDPVSIVSKKYGVIGVPTTFFIDRHGTAKKVVLGEMRPDLFEKTVGELL